jgi:sugar phosphate isomerase/epimerase
MSITSRRSFLDCCAAGLSAAGALSIGPTPAFARPLGMPIGFQLYSVREQAAKDFQGTLRDLSAAGYRAVELCSFAGYGDFKPLAPWKAGEVLTQMKAARIHCESCHYTPDELRSHLDDRILYAKELGLKYMILSSFGLKPEAVLDDWRRAADNLNPVGERVAKAGLQLGFHNHNNEFKEMDGILIYDELMKHLDPRLVKMQFQCAVVSIGYDPVTYLTKYPGRFCSLHLADWSSSEKKMVPLGKGVIDWKRLFRAAKSAGVKNYFVEMNPDLLKESSTYLQGLNL